MRIKKDLPTVTVCTVMLFVFVYAFKMGEAYFFGYPQYYIYLDTSEVINASLKLLTLCFLVLIFAISASLTYKILAYVILCIAIINKVIRLTTHFNNGDLTTNGAINLGTSYILVALLLILIPKAYIIATNSITLKALPSLCVTVLFLILSFFFGWNYHSFFPGNIWQTEDQKIVVGRYQDNFILRQCYEGKPFFYLQPVANSKFEMFAINTDGVLNLRCQPEIDKTESEDYLLQKQTKKNPA